MNERQFKLLLDAFVANADAMFVFQRMIDVSITSLRDSLLSIHEPSTRQEYLGRIDTLLELREAPQKMQVDNNFEVFN
jgi:hypothetical protein